MEEICIDLRLAIFRSIPLMATNEWENMLEELARYALSYSTHVINQFHKLVTKKGF